MRQAEYRRSPSILSAYFYNYFRYRNSDARGMAFSTFLHQFGIEISLLMKTAELFPAQLRVIRNERGSLELEPRVLVSAKIP